MSTEHSLSQHTTTVMVPNLNLNENDGSYSSMSNILDIRDQLPTQPPSPPSRTPCSSSSTHSSEIDRMNGWTCEYVKLVKRKGEQAMASQWLHSKSHKRFKMMDGMLGGTMTVLSFTGGFLESEQMSTTFLKYISFMVGFLAMVQQLMNLSGKSAVHKTTMDEYADIVNSITTEIAKKPEDREEVHTFLNNTRHRIFLSSKNAPVIPDSIMKSFQSKFNDITPADQINIDYMNKLVIQEHHLKRKKKRGRSQSRLPSRHPGRSRSRRKSVAGSMDSYASVSGRRSGSVETQNVLQKMISDRINVKTYCISPPVEYQLNQLKHESL